MSSPQQQPNTKPQPRRGSRVWRALLTVLHVMDTLKRIARVFS